MKILSFILSVLILVLSCLPCTDGNVLACEKPHHSSSSNSHSNKTDKEHMDLCSPFCQCSCCAIAYTLPLEARVQVMVVNEFGNKVFYTHYQQRPTRISLPIWQPPQLA